MAVLGVVSAIFLGRFFQLLYGIQISLFYRRKGLDLIFSILFFRLFYGLLMTY